MTRVPAFMLDSTLSVAPPTGHSARGPVFGVAVDVPAYVEPGNRLAVDRDGRTVVCNLFAITDPDAAVEVQSRIVYQSQTYEAIDVQPIDGDHLEVYARSVAV